MDEHFIAWVFPGFTTYTTSHAILFWSLWITMVSGRAMYILETPVAGDDMHRQCIRCNAGGSSMLSFARFVGRVHSIAACFSRRHSKS